MRNPNFARTLMHAKFWTPLAQNPESAPAVLVFLQCKHVSGHLIPLYSISILSVIDLK